MGWDRVWTGGEGCRMVGIAMRAAWPGCHLHESIMELLLNSLQQPFTWGLLLGLMVAGFTWKSGFAKAREMKRENRRLEDEMKGLQTHLNTQLKINATGNETMQTQLDELRRQNENLRVNYASLQQKPGRAEMRMLRAQEAAVAKLREQAPGFAAAWEKAMREAETDLESAEGGLRKLVRRVMPAIGTSAASHSNSGDDVESIEAPQRDDP